MTILKRKTMYGVLAGAFVLAGCATQGSVEVEPGSCTNASSATLLGGFVSVSQAGHDKDCGERQVEAMLLGSEDPGMQAVGQSLLEGRRKDAAEAGDAVRAALLQRSAGEVSCEVESVEQKGGQRVVNLGGCTPQ